MTELHVVTGAFGYSGKYITTRLLDAGVRVRTLTNSLQRANPFGDKVEAHPFNFDQPPALIESLRGASVLYNTYSSRTDRIAARRECVVQHLLDSLQHQRAGLSTFGGGGKYVEVV